MNDPSTTHAAPQPGPVSVVVDLDLKRQLEQLAERDDRSLSATIRRACRTYVASELAESQSTTARGVR